MWMPDATTPAPTPHDAHPCVGFLHLEMSMLSCLPGDMLHRHWVDFPIRAIPGKASPRINDHKKKNKLATARKKPHVDCKCCRPIVQRLPLSLKCCPSKMGSGVPHFDPPTDSMCANIYTLTIDACWAPLPVYNAWVWLAHTNGPGLRAHTETANLMVWPGSGFPLHVVQCMVSPVHAK